MRKRNLVALIITLIAVIASNKLWLRYEYVHLSLNASGKGFCRVSAQLNKNDSDEFKKIKNDTKIVNLSDNLNIDFFIKRAKVSKRLRFVFNNCNSDIVKILDVNIFENEGGGV